MKANILIIESNNSDFNFIKSILKQTSANLFRAKSYNKTLKLFSEHFFEIIIINVEVDDQSGLDIIREVRKMPRGQEVKIILFARSYPDEKQIAEAVNLGVVDFISKPLNKQILLGKTNTYLDLIISQKLLIENEIREKVSAQTIINNSPVIAFRWRNDENQSMEYVSENITRLSGYSMNDFLSGQYKIIDVVHPDDLSRVMEEVVTFSSETEKTSFTHKPFRITRKDKSVIWVDERLIIIRNEDGKVVKFQGMLIDITEQIEAEKSSEVERSKARKYLELVDVMMMAVDKMGLVTMVNPKTCEVLKYEKSELLGKDWILKVLYREDGEDILDIDEFLADDFPDYFENYILTKSGEKRLIVWHKTSLKDEKGKIDGVLCSGQDVTSQRLSELENMKLTTAIEHSNSSIVITDINGNIEYVNPYFTEITGYSLEEVVGQNSRILKSSEIKLEEYKNLWETISSGENWKGEFHNLKKSGESYWESAVIAPVKNNDGKIINYIAVKQDITAQKNAEILLNKNIQELEYSRELFKTYSDSSFHAMFLSQKGICIGQNKIASQMFGYSLEEAIGKPGTDWIIPEHRELVANNMKDDFEEQYRVWALRKDGTKFPCEIQAKLVDHAGDRVRVTSLSDISKQYQVEEELKKSEDRYRSLIQDSETIMMIFEPAKGIILEVNQAACEFYGYAKDEFIGMNMFAINTLSRKEILKELKLNIDEKKNKFIFKHKISNGEIRDVEVNTTRMDWQGQKVHFSIIFDITDKIKADRDLIDAKEKAEESDRLKSAFLANMSHEIRTPMNAILGFSQLLNTPGLTSDDKHSYLSIINNTGNQLLNIIDDIINISRIEAGIIDLTELEFDLNRIVEDTYETIKVNAEMEKVDLSYSAELKDEKAIILGDKGKLSQILINLINNAVKFTKSGGSVKFGYSINENKLLFYVKDTGIGIEAKDQKIIFERFRQVEHKGKVYGGTGIGLSIVSAFINKMGGKIWLESQIGEGTTFYFELPYKPVYTEDIEPEDVNHKYYLQKLNGKTILIAEDEDLNFLLMAEFFKDANVNILHAENGKEAVELFMSNEGISLVIMDLKMPVMSGYDATIKIKKIRPKVPVIAQTAYAMSTDRANALSVGCDDYIAKPIVFEEFIKLISKYI